MEHPENAPAQRYVKVHRISHDFSDFPIKKKQTIQLIQQQTKMRHEWQVELSKDDETLFGMGFRPSCLASNLQSISSFAFAADWSQGSDGLECLVVEALSWVRNEMHERENQNKKKKNKQIS